MLTSQRALFDIPSDVAYLNAAEMTAFVEKQAAYYTDIAGKIGGSPRSSHC
jgi:hypothetical protein